MDSSERAAITAVGGRGELVISTEKEHRVILPPVPSGEGMKRAVLLHCDIAARPYRIEDFRQPLDQVGVLREVVGIGAYQMAHVWLLDLRTEAAKQKVIEAGRLTVKGRTCLVVDPARQELRVKVHWVSFDVPNDAIRRAFSEYGDVKEVAL